MEGETAEKDWEGNDGVDVLARTLARRCADDRPIEDRFLKEAQHEQVLRRLAAAAGWNLRNWPLSDPKRKKGRSSRTTGGEPRTHVGDHEVQARAKGGVICTACRLYAATPTSLKSLRQTPCRGSIAHRCHGTHRLHFLTGVTWCSRCGAYASKRPRALRSQCPGMAPTEARRNVLKRLRLGLMPTTAAYLREVRMDSATAVVLHSGVSEELAVAPADHVTLDQEGVGARSGDGQPEDDREAVDHQGHRQGIRTASPGAEARAASHLQANGVAMSLPGPPLADGDHDVPSLIIVGVHDGGRAGTHRPDHGGEAVEGRHRGSAAAPPRPIVSPCQPRDSDHWSRRLHSTGVVVAARCTICGSLTRTRCRGCLRAVCLGCAKLKAHCVVEG